MINVNTREGAGLPGGSINIQLSVNPDSYADLTVLLGGGGTKKNPDQCILSYNSATLRFRALTNYMKVIWSYAVLSTCRTDARPEPAAANLRRLHSPSAKRQIQLAR